MNWMQIYWTLLFLLGASSSHSQVVSPPVKMLALGDSYTIGQSVPAQERWPVQLRDSLKARGVAWDTLEIIAATGWRTDNLANAMNTRQLDSTYNLVSLLIGVNNQFQGLDTTAYAAEFEALLRSAIGLAQGDTDQVLVLSIPDYAYTPFGQGSNPAAISKGIDDFNAVNLRITRQYGVAYFDITPISREGWNRPALVAGDGLHPSGLQYSEWVGLLLDSLTTKEPVAIPVREHLPWQAWPNPVHDRLHIAADDEVSFTLLNGNGKVWQQGTGNRSYSTLGWPAGAYYIVGVYKGKRYTQIMLKH